MSASLCSATLLVLCCACLPEQSIKMFIRGRPITMYIPSNIQNYEDLKMEPPSEKLELDWVYPCIMPQQCTASCSYLAGLCYIQTGLISLCGHFLDSSHTVYIRKCVSNSVVSLSAASTTDYVIAVNL